LCVFLFIVCSSLCCIINPSSYPYVAPGPNDQRGPCPGLNAFANHGYLPHNGEASLTQLINVCTQVGGFDLELATVLSVYELLFTGSILTQQVSLGGSLLLVGPGFDYHGGIESDASLTRGDAYFGDNHSFNVTKWNEMAGISASSPQPWGIEFFSGMRYLRYTQSLATNPLFYYTALQFIITSAGSYFANRVFRLPGQDATLTTMSSFFINEALPDGFGCQSDQITVVDVLANAFYMYWENPVPLTTIGTSPLAFPTNVTCMVCFLRTIIMAQIPLLNTINILLEPFLNSNLLDTYLQCLYPSCGY